MKNMEKGAVDGAELDDVIGLIGGLSADCLEVYSDF